jgi:hypothetical protein
MTLRSLVVLLVAAIAIVAPATASVAQEVSLSAPGSAPLNSTVEVTWSGPNAEGDYIGIGDEAGNYIAHAGYAYTAKSSGVVQLRLPEAAGSYTVAYVNKQRETLYFVPIVVESVSATLAPIAHSLDLVESDLSAVDGERVVILITDGEETCDGDPTAAISTLRGKSVDLRVNIVGYAIDDASLADTLPIGRSLAAAPIFPPRTSASSPRR